MKTDRHMQREVFIYLYDKKIEGNYYSFDIMTFSGDGLS